MYGSEDSEISVKSTVSKCTHVPPRAWGSSQAAPAQCLASACCSTAGLPGCFVRDAAKESRLRLDGKSPRPDFVKSSSFGGYGRAVCCECAISDSDSDTKLILPPTRRIARKTGPPSSYLISGSVTVIDRIPPLPLVSNQGVTSPSPWLAPKAGHCSTCAHATSTSRPAAAAGSRGASRDPRSVRPSPSA